MIDFSVNNAQMAQMASAANTATSSTVTGSLMGQAAQLVDSPMDLIADAAEELTFSADTTDDFELKQREEREKKLDHMADRVRMYQEMMHEAGKSQDIDRLKDSLRAREGKETALRQAQQRFPDLCDAWAALSEALADLEQENNENPGSVGQDVLDDIRAGLRQLEEEHGSEIRSGVQGALAARGYTDLGSADELKGLYQQAVLDFDTVNDVFTHLQESYGDVSFDRALDFLYKTLGNDLAADVPSMETTHLEHVQGNLDQVRLLQSAHAQCDRLLNRWETVHGVATARENGFTPMQLLGDILNLRKENFLGAMHIETIAAKAKAPEIEHEVLFLQELMNTARSFPPSLFDDNQGRMKVLDAIQTAVDAAIEREDAYLASQEDF